MSERYMHPRRAIILAALRYAISHIECSIEGSDDKTAAENEQAWLADFQRMHQRMTGERWLA